MDGFDGPIDVKTVIRRKNPALEQIIPSTLVRYLERIIHQAELNAGLRRLEDTRDLDFLAGALHELRVATEVRGEEFLPTESRIIAVSNHPLGGLDGIALIDLLGKNYGEIRVPVNDLLLNLPNIESLFVPVNKHGTNRDYFAKIEAAFAGDASVLHFPAGLCSRRRGGTIRDLRWQKSFIVRARRHRRDVVPIHFGGRNSGFFYGLANLRRWLGLRLNIEMLYLVDEMFKQRNNTFTITVGKPISWRTFDGRLDDWRWAQQVKRHVYSLSDNEDASFLWTATPETERLRIAQ